MTSKERANADEERAGLRRRELPEVLLAGVRALREIPFRIAGRRGIPAAQIATGDVDAGVLETHPPRQAVRQTVRQAELTQLREAGVLDLLLGAVGAVDQRIVILILEQRLRVRLAGVDVDALPRRPRVAVRGEDRTAVRTSRTASRS